MHNYVGNTYKTDNRQYERKITKLWGLIFLYSTFSGAIRKWGESNDLTSNIVFGIQLILPFFFLLLRRPGYQSPFNKLLIIYTVILLLLAFNPMNLTIFHGLFGLLLHLGFWVCCFFYIQNRELFNLNKIALLFIIVALMEITLAFVQYNLPPTHFLNAYANEERVNSIATFNGRVRVTGTFSYLGGFYAFFTFFPLFLWGLIRLQYPRYVVIFLYMAGLVACFMSGSRTTLYVYLVVGAFMIYAEGGLKQLMRTLGATLLIAGLISMVMYFLNSKFGFIGDTVSLAFENFEGRRKKNAASGEEEQRITASFNDVISFPGDYPLVGVGLGATYQGATAVFGTSRYILEYPSYFEEEPERVVIEGGFVLLILKLVLLISLFRYIRIPVISKIVLGALIFLYIPIVFNTYNSIFLALGLIFLDNTYRAHKGKDLLPSGKNA